MESVLEINTNICQQCLDIAPINNQCYFCNLRLCEKCLDDSYYSYHHCSKCQLTWCYYDGRYTDYPCQKAKYEGDCEECGH